MFRCCYRLAWGGQCEVTSRWQAGDVGSIVCQHQEQSACRCIGDQNERSVVVGCLCRETNLVGVNSLVSTARSIWHPIPLFIMQLSCDVSVVRIMGCGLTICLVLVELHSSSYSPLHPRKSTMRKSLKHLFSASPKFQKTLKRWGFNIVSLVQ